MDLDKFMREIKPRQNPYRVHGFSFGSRMEEDYGRTGQQVGPGTYNLTSSPSKIGSKFGHSERFDRSPQTKANIPGPGSYTTDSVALVKSKLNESPVGKKGTFSKAERMGLFNKTESNIGPGQYAIKREFEDLSKMRASQEFKLNNENSIASKTLRAFAIKDTPGPGQYDVPESLSSGHKEGVGYSIGQATRDFLGLSQTVKQGLSGDIYKYNRVEPMGQGSPKVGFTKGKRSELSPMKEGPSPTAYFSEPQDSLSKAKGGVFYQATRGIHAKDQALGPGPGEYEINTTSLIKGYRISGGEGHNTKNSESSPGPGHYDVLAEFDEKRREIDKKLSLHYAKSPKNSSHTDGLKSPTNQTLTGNFGSDEPCSTSQSVLVERPVKKMGSTKTMWVEDAIKQSVSPGPMYMVKTDHINTQAGHIGTRFSTLIRPEFVATEIKKNIPGPGAYEDKPEDQEEKWTKFAISKRKDNPVLPEYTLAIPGPGRYENIRLKDPAGGSFGKAVKKLESNNGSPDASPKRRGKRGNSHKSRSPVRNT